MTAVDVSWLHSFDQPPLAPVDVSWLRLLNATKRPGGSALGAGDHVEAGGHHRPEDRGPEAGGERVHHRGPARLGVSRDPGPGFAKVQAVRYHSRRSFFFVVVCEFFVVFSLVFLKRVFLFLQGY